MSIGECFRAFTVVFLKTFQHIEENIHLTGLTSLQEAAIDVLKFYQTKFSSFNHYLDKVRHCAITFFSYSIHN